MMGSQLPPPILNAREPLARGFSIQSLTKDCVIDRSSPLNSVVLTGTAVEASTVPASCSGVHKGFLEVDCRFRPGCKCYPSLETSANIAIGVPMAGALLALEKQQTGALSCTVYSSVGEVGVECRIVTHMYSESVSLYLNLHMPHGKTSGRVWCYRGL